MTIGSAVPRRRRGPGASRPPSGPRSARGADGAGTAYNRGALAGGRLRRLRRLLLRRDVPGAALHQAARGLRGLGPRASAPPRWPTRPPAASAPTRPPDLAEACARMRCEVLVVHGTDDTICPYDQGTAAGRGHRRAARHPRGRRPRAAGPRPGHAQPADQGRSWSAPRPGCRAPSRRWTHALARPKRALYLSSPIGLGHARRDLAIARELRDPPPRPADRLAGPASRHGGARVGRRAGAPGVGAAGQRVEPHRGRVRRARPPRLPGHPSDGRDPRQQLHGLRRPRRRRALRPGDRRRGLGRRPLPPREPGAEAVRASRG